MDKNEAQSFDIQKNLNIGTKKSLFRRLGFWIAIVVVVAVVGIGLFILTPKSQASVRIQDCGG